MAHEYLVDSKLFYSKIAGMEPEDRAQYILTCAINMVSDRIDENWIREKPKPRGRQKKVKKAYNQGYTFEFEEFWRCYPKKSAKGSAFAIWQDLEDDKGELLRACLLALSWQRDTESWLEGYIPKGENYLAGRCWEDEAPEKARTETMGVPESSTGRRMVL